MYIVIPSKTATLLGWPFCVGIRLFAWKTDCRAGAFSCLLRRDPAGTVLIDPAVLDHGMDTVAQVGGEVAVAGLDVVEPEMLASAAEFLPLIAMTGHNGSPQKYNSRSTTKSQ